MGFPLSFLIGAVMEQLRKEISKGKGVQECERVVLREGEGEGEGECLRPG